MQPAPARQSRRRLVAESWARSVASARDPEGVPGRVDVSDAELRAYRHDHALALVRPVIEQLLVRHATGSGLLVAIGDRAGRLLWVDGDHDARRRAESMAFLEGADWSEATAGTSAPGTALVVGRPVQIHREEHYARMVHPWSCSAVPLRDRATGTLLGVLDVTGGDEAVAPGVLPLLEATAAAVEAELALRASGARPLALPGRTGSQDGTSADGATTDAPGPRSGPGAVGPAKPGVDARTGRSRVTVARTTPTLNVLGRDDGLLRTAAGETRLSARHSEILVLLAHHRAGLSAGELAALVHGRDDATVTLRAEMVRLRRTLEPVAPGLVPLTRPYRLPGPLDVDAHRVLAFLERGAHRVALAAYPGPVLPASGSPGVVALRDLVRGRLREALLADASVETLLDFARSSDGVDDVEVWRTALRLLPARSPRRAGVVLHLEGLDRAAR